MEKRAEISLQDILSAVGGPLEEKSLWALLKQSCSLLEHELKAASQTSDPDLLITTESVLLYHGGTVMFLRGIADTKSNFRAPELLGDKNCLLDKEDLEKIYVYSLGMTLFTAMQYGLEEGQVPRVGNDINTILVSMVEDAAQERKTLSEIEFSCRKEISQKDSMIEVDRLVSYVLGTEAELSLSDAADLDGANLEAEIQKVMNIPRTGSVEHLYSPSYGSRTSSSLSVNSATCNLQHHSSIVSQDSGNQAIQSQYSSMPLVYFASQDRINKQVHSQRAHALENNSWSSFDRLTSPLLSHEVDVLASKGKVGGVSLHISTYPHPKYTSHLYTPTRVRKSANKRVGRSASFENHDLSISRTASDGMYKTVTSDGVENIRPSFNIVTFEDMPSLPPPYASVPNDSIDSPIKHVPPSSGRISPPTVPPSVEKIDSILQSVERHKSADVAAPPLPSTEPPMFTPYKVEKEVSHSPVPLSLPPLTDSPVASSSPLLPDTPTTFDYSELGSPPQSPLDTSKVECDDFEFASPPPIPVFSPPQDERETDTHALVAEIEPLHSTLGKEAWAESEKTKNIDRTITPRRALVEAFKELDKIGESPLVTANISEQEDSAIDALYAKVDMSKKSKKSAPSGTGSEPSKEDANPEEDVTSQDENRDNGPTDLDALYAKVDMSKKTRRGPTAGDSTENGPELVPSDKDVPVGTAKNDSTVDPAYEAIHVTGGAPTSQAPTNPSKFSLADPGYARIEDIWPASGGGQTDSSDTQPTSGVYSEVHTKVTLETKGDLVRKASSEANVTEVDFAVVHHPQRASMPPGGMPGSELDYETVRPLPSKTTESSEVHSTKARLYEMTTENAVGSNQASLKKLQTVFGPEFTKLSGGPLQPKEKGSVTRSNSRLIVPEGRRVVKVILLNGKSVQFVVESESICQDLFQQVLSHQSLQSKRIFGLATIDDRDEVFMELDRQLSKYAPPGWATTPVPPPSSRSHQPPEFTVFFRIKYYVENVTELRLSQTRHQLYMQLRKDTLEGKMYCHEESALKLAAHALQAEKGDFPTKNNLVYFKLEDYMQKKIINKLGQSKAERLLADIHAEEKGKTREEAELNFLREAQMLPEYGVIFYRVSKEKHTPLGSQWLGFSIRGIIVYDIHKDIKTPTTHCPWRTTANLSYSNRKFIVEQVDAKPLVFYTKSYKRARYLLRLSISYHRFQLISRGLLPKELPPDGDQSKPSTPKLEQPASLSPTHGSFKATLFNDKSGSDDRSLQSQDSQVHQVKILKEMGKGLGILISSKSSLDTGSCVVIDSIEKDGPAFMDRRLKKGDILLSVDGKEVEGLNHKQVGEILKSASDLVTITVRRPLNPKCSTPISPPDQMTTVVVEIEDHVSYDTGSSPNTSSAAPPNELSEKDTTPEVSPEDRKPLDSSPTAESDQEVALKVSPSEPVVTAPPKPGDKIISVDDVNVVEESHDEELQMIQESETEVSLSVSPKDTTPSSSEIQNLPPGTSFVIELVKKQGSLGMRLAGGKGKPSGLGFIYIKKVTEGSKADENGLKTNDIIIQVNNESVADVTHREVAVLIKNSGKRVLIHGHHPHDPLWLEGHPTSHQHKVLARDVSSSSIYIPDTLSLQLQASPTELASIQEDRETQLEQDKITKEKELLAVDITPPELPADGPPLDESLLQDEASVGGHLLSIPLLPSSDLMGSTSEPQLLSDSDNLAVEGVSAVKSESFLWNKTAATVDEKEGRTTVVLQKGLRGLGFTLDRTLSGQPGHGVFVLCVNEDPARSDGTIRAGDEIVQVNDNCLVDCSHKEALSVFRQTECRVSLVIQREPDLIEEEELNEPPPVPPVSPLPLDDSLAGSSEFVSVKENEVQVVSEDPYSEPFNTNMSAREETEDRKQSSLNENFSRDMEEQAHTQELSDEEIEAHPLSVQPSLTEEQTQETEAPLLPSPPVGDIPAELSHSEGDEETSPPHLPQTLPQLREDSSDTDDNETPPPIVSLSPLPDDQSLQETSQSSSPLNSLTTHPIKAELDTHDLFNSEDNVSDVNDDEDISTELRLDDSSTSDDLQPDHSEEVPPIPYTPPPSLGSIGLELTKSEELLSPNHI